MPLFWIRFSTFSLLWLYMISQYSTFLAGSVLCFAISLGCLFFWSLDEPPFIFFVGMSVVQFMHGIYFVQDTIMPIIVIVYSLFISAYVLKQRKFIIFISLTSIFIIALLLLIKHNQIELFMLYSICIFFAWIWNRQVQERLEQRELYERLLSEYRQLKRMNVRNEENARVEERNKIARDIHDAVGHRLTALMMQLEMLAIQKQDHTFRDLKQMAEESLAETRKAVTILQTDETEGIATVVHLIRKLEAESHITVQFTLKQGILSLAISNEKSVVLYRVIQEALTNAMRHALSREVTVSLGKDAIDQISFEITNVISEPKAFTYGFGLTNMNKRVGKVNGKLDVYQTDHHFIVRGSIPSD